MQINTLSIIGAGAVSTCLAPWLQKSGYDILAVHSRSIHSAEALAERLGCAAIGSIENLPNADAFLICISDDALPQVAPSLRKSYPDSLLVHTSGGMGIDVFGADRGHCAVMYPLQSFTLGVDLDVPEIPFFVEGSDAAAMDGVEKLASSLSSKVLPLDGAGRARLHLAAVFASNFSNHCCALAADLMERYGLDWKLLLPLIDETAHKLHRLAPRLAQTGPASRCDREVVQTELELLHSDASLPKIYSDIYNIMSRSIMDGRTNG